MPMNHQTLSLNYVLNEVDREYHRLKLQRPSAIDRSNRPDRPLILAPKPRPTFKGTAVKLLRGLKQRIKNKLKWVLRA